MPLEASMTSLIQVVSLCPGDERRESRSPLFRYVGLGHLDLLSMNSMKAEFNLQPTNFINRATDPD